MTQAAASRGEDPYEADPILVDREAEVEEREVEVEMGETELNARGLGLIAASDWQMTATASPMSETDMPTCARRRPIAGNDSRMSVKGTAAARGVERVERLRQREERDRAAARRAQAAVMRGGSWI